MNNDGAILVKKQALVNFEIGSFKDKVWCDVVPMYACSLLLWRPWQWDHDAILFGKNNVYTIAHEGGRICFQPLPPKTIAASDVEYSKTNSAKEENMGN